MKIAISPPLFPTRGACLLLACLLFSCLALAAGEAESAASSTIVARRSIYVSKLGDNSDGSSWAKAFRTIQAA